MQLYEQGEYTPPTVASVPHSLWLLDGKISHVANLMTQLLKQQKQKRIQNAQETMRLLLPS